MPRPSRFAVLALLALLPACATSDPGATPSPSPTATPGPQLRCSAEDAEVAEATGLDDLPDPVVRVRAEITAAARECDYAELESIARRLGPSFTYDDQGPRRGDTIQASGYWRNREVQGDPVLTRLVFLLNLPWSSVTFDGADSPADLGSGEVTVYSWPSTTSDGIWGELEEIYPATDVAQWRADGVYLGERVSITEAGRWFEFAPARRT
ncbi:MAG TPA: hypothetical protein VM840_00260 [Actinomycetota bacterium]|nr:hypothetical protein [Actinomycetota bacterium]